MRIVLLSLQLLGVLLLMPRPAYILVQNPPSLPTLAVAWMVGLVRGVPFVVDWHNLGFTLLALRICGREGGNAMGELSVVDRERLYRRPLIRFARGLEGWFGRRATASLCVSSAMREWLFANFGLRRDSIHVVYDRPPGFFQRTSATAFHKLLGIATVQNESGERVPLCAGNGAALRLLTVPSGAPEDGAVWNPKRPALLVSSTSWTPDEDFTLLWCALRIIDERWTAEQSAKDQVRTVSANGASASGDVGRTATLGPAPAVVPRAIVVITGKGPLRAAAMAALREHPLRHIAVHSVWLGAQDYPLLLGAADLGISLHRSSSGLDLPMKVVDMFGCQLPVVALRFSCVEELVQPDQNGLLFESGEELAGHLEQLLNSFPSKPRLDEFEEALKNFPRWADEWRAHAAPVFGAATSEGGGGAASITSAAESHRRT